MSAQLQRTLVWLLFSVVALVVTLQMSSASFVDGHYLPVGHDAFYHGRRILDAIASGHLYQFDPRIHVPEGDWITWPWAYDTALTDLVRLILPLTGGAEPATVLMHLPPLLAVAGVALVVAIAAELQLSLGLIALAAACFACSAFTQYQFGVGALDHHGAEQLSTLAALWLGLRWLARPESAGRACTLGVVLGLMLGVHAGLFILQIPLLGAVLLGWWRGEQLSVRSANYFCAAVVVGALSILLPAATFWQSRFVLYYLSWLHLYVSVGTCVVVQFTARRPCDRRNAVWLLSIGVALALPLVATLVFSSEFLTGKLSDIGDIDEIQSPFAIARNVAAGGSRRIMMVYTNLIWIAPITLLLCAWKTVRASSRREAFFWLSSAFGAALLLAQLRLGSYGIMFTYLPWLVLCHQWLANRPRAVVVAAMLTLAVAFLVAYYPTLRYQLFGRKVLAMDQQYATLRAVLPALQHACASDPGVVLAEPGEGHLVRYFTECSVISNNFRLTPLDIRKVQESLDLIAQPVGVVRQRAPAVKYVIARLVAPNESPNPVLFRQLLTSGSARPAGTEALVELTVTHPGGKTEKFMGVYKIRP